MKKFICIVMVLLVFSGCLTACTFTQNRSGVLAGEAESAVKVEEMMTALAYNRISDAKTLMHPQTVEGADTAIAQMSAYLDGREVASLKQLSINVNTSTGTSGKARQEQVNYQVTLTDGVIIYLNVVYLSDNSGDGFISFQLVLGVV